MSTKELTSFMLSLRFLATALFLIVAPATASGQITPDGTTRTTVTRHEGEADRIAIAPITRNGVSLNRYTQFNVAPRGVSFDNSVETARSIVNEVTGPSPSSLEGPVTIRGARAHLIIANPNGLSVDGVRFSNVGRLMLTTGAIGTVERRIAPGVTQTNLSVRTDKGTIAIGADGLSGAMDRIMLVARRMRIAGALVNSDRQAESGVRLFAGAGDVEIDTAVAPTEFDFPWVSATARPAEALGEVILTIASPGSLEGNRIAIAVTDRGAGVRSAGGMMASGEDIAITVAGDIDFAPGSRTEAARHISLESGGAARFSGSAMTAGGAMNLTAAGALEVSGSEVTGTGDMVLQAGAIALQGGAARTALSARFGAICLRTRRLDAACAGTDENAAGEGAAVEAEGGITLSAALQAGGGDVRLDTGGMARFGKGASVDAAETIAVTAGGIHAEGAALTARQEDVLFSGEGTGESAGVTLQDTTLDAGRNVALTSAGALTEGGGAYRMGGDLSLSASGAMRLRRSEAAAGGALTLAAGGGLTGEGIAWASFGDVAIDARTVTLSPHEGQGTLSARFGAICVSAGHSVAPCGGVTRETEAAEGRGAVTLSGTLHAGGGDVRLDTDGMARFGKGAILDAAETLAVTAQGLHADGAELTARQEDIRLTLEGREGEGEGRLTDTRLQAGGDIALGGQDAIAASESVFRAGGALSLSSPGSFRFSQVEAFPEGRLTLTAGGVFEGDGLEWSAGNALRMRAGSLSFTSNARRTRISSRLGALTLQAGLTGGTGDIRNEGGYLRGQIRDTADPASKGALTIQAQGAFRNISMDTTKLAILFAETGDLHLRAGGDVENDTGRLAANGAIDLQAGGRIVNHVAAPGGARAPVLTQTQRRGGRSFRSLWLRHRMHKSWRLDYGAPSLAGNVAQISGNSVRLHAGGALHNIGAEINANTGDAVITAQEIVNEAFGQGAAFMNRVCDFWCTGTGGNSIGLFGGRISAAAAIQASAAKRFLNRGGTLLGLGGVRITAPEAAFESLSVPTVVVRPYGVRGVLTGGKHVWVYWRDREGRAFASSGALAIETRHPVKLHGLPFFTGARVHIPAGQEIVRPAETVSPVSAKNIGFLQRLLRGLEG